MTSDHLCRICVEHYVGNGRGAQVYFQIISHNIAASLVGRHLSKLRERRLLRSAFVCSASPTNLRQFRLAACVLSLLRNQGKNRCTVAGSQLYSQPFFHQLPATNQLGDITGFVYAIHRVLPVSDQLAAVDMIRRMFDLDALEPDA